MSTRCRIGIEYDDKTVKSIYCHHDGYPEWVGKKLKENYTDVEKVEALLELGDISSLGKTCNSELAKKHWGYLDNNQYDKLGDDEFEDLTIPYKDRGEDCPAIVDRDKWDYKDSGSESCAEYLYLFSKDDNGNYRWLVLDVYPDFEEL